MTLGLPRSGPNSVETAAVLLRLWGRLREGHAEPGPDPGGVVDRVVILLFAPMVPSTPRKMLTAAFAAASMGPIAAVLWQLPGGGRSRSAPGARALDSELSLRGHRRDHRAHHEPLGGEVRKAREMGSYVLGDLIARGGMGEVWRATHRFLARPAVI